MSRSYRKTPVTGHSCSTSEKEDKKMCHQMFRARVRTLMNQEEYDKLPFRMREVLDTWSMAKDGKSYWKNAPAYAMRK
jgi:hypothetical protein